MNLHTHMHVSLYTHVSLHTHIQFYFHFLQSGAEKRAATDVAKKPKTPKKKKKKDPNEPQKPVSAYALFFRDTQAAIKGQNPNATFGEVSKIVASMWDGLGEEQKQVLQSAFFILYYTHCYFLKMFFTGFINGTNIKLLYIVITDTECPLLL